MKHVISDMEIQIKDADGCTALPGMLPSDRRKTIAFSADTRRPPEDFFRGPVGFSFFPLSSPNGQPFSMITVSSSSAVSTR